MRINGIAAKLAMVAGQAIAAGVACGQWADNFNRADGGLGAAWLNGGGTFADFSVSGNRGAHSVSTSDIARSAAASASYRNVTQTIDVFKSPSLDFVALTTGLGGANNLFIKLQGSLGTYDQIGFYSSNNVGGGWAGAAPVFPFLSAPFSSGRMYEYFTNAGDTLNVAIDTDFDGRPDQTYSRSGVAAFSAAFGTGLGVGAYGPSHFDNWRVMPSFFPPDVHTSLNLIPFGSGDSGTMHQVFNFATFPAPVRITQLRFAPTSTGTLRTNVSINLGYTRRFAGLASPAGLSLPTAGGGGDPNAYGPISGFFSNSNFQQTFASADPEDFQLAFGNAAGFVYFPLIGNLMLETNTTSLTGSDDIAVSRANGSPNSSRSHLSVRFGNLEDTTRATRVQMVAIPFTPTVLPTRDETNANAVPFRSGNSLGHQVYHWGAVSPMAEGAAKLAIQGIAYAPGENTTLDADLDVRIGYTNRVPSFASPTGLDTPNVGGGGAPNASGPLRSFFAGHVTQTFSSFGPFNFQFVLHQTPFVFEVGSGNLLVETGVSGLGTIGTYMSRTEDSLESTRTARTTTFGITSPGPLRTKFITTPVTDAVYPDHAAADSLNVPFAIGHHVTHQVFASSQFGDKPVRIDQIAYAPAVNGQFDATSVIVRMGYTTRESNVNPPAGLAVPDSAGGGGDPNTSIDAMVPFRTGTYSRNMTSASASNFQLRLKGDAPFLYDPLRGNLLVEVVTAVPGTTTSEPVSSWNTATQDSSIAILSDVYASLPYVNYAPRVQFTYFTDLYPCAADLNGDGTVDLVDFFSFFNCFSDSDRCAEQDGVAGIDLGDFFAFFNVWDGGC